LRALTAQQILGQPNGPEREAPMSYRSPGYARVFMSLGIAAAVVAILAGAATPATAAARGGPPLKYYLSLGDSLSQGVQPATPPLPPGVSLGQSIETDQGYTDDLFAHYSGQFPGNLQLVKLGCPGETTSSMLTGAGSPCKYPAGSQLAQAVAFIRDHRSAVVLVTIDIGANNVDGCAAGGTINLTCVANGFAEARTDMPKILGALRDVVGEDTVIAGMNFYDPFLADYLTGAAGQALAEQSVTLDAAFNSLLGASFAAFGVPVADVQSAFSTTDFTDTATLPGAGTVPLNVARICEWTWMCAPSPFGPNIHANAVGYQAIATAFQQVIGSLD
jgi:lysophospholipase L1-like esterase